MILLALLFGAAAMATSAQPVPTDDQVIATLIDALKDTDPDVRTNLSAALAKFGAVAVEPLVKALKDDSAGRRAGAAYALGQLGSQAKPALPQLLELLKDEQVEVRRQVSFAISRIVPVKGAAVDIPPPPPSARKK
jgi:HEAT repeat protein